MEVSHSPHKACQLAGALPLVLVGFSVRSLAEAAKKAGFPVFAIDHFGDDDLRAIVEQCEVVESWGPAKDNPPVEVPKPGTDCGNPRENPDSYPLKRASHDGQQTKYEQTSTSGSQIARKAAFWGGVQQSDALRRVLAALDRFESSSIAGVASETRHKSPSSSQSAKASNQTGAEHPASQAGAEHRLPGARELGAEHTSELEAEHASELGAEHSVQSVEKWWTEKWGAEHLRPILLAGGAETWLELVETLEKRFIVLGPTSTQIKKLRDPVFCRRLALKAGVCSPKQTFHRPPRAAVAKGCEEVASAANKASINWLQKSIWSSGGMHVRRVSPVDDKAQPYRENSSDSRAGERDGYLGAFGPKTVYYQREISGRVLGVSCVLHDLPSDTAEHEEGDYIELLGVVESWNSQDWPGPTEYIYRGCWGPIQLTHEQTQALRRLASQVARELGMVGWLQMDVIEDPEGQLWLLEFNPRWASSMEILDACGCRPLDKHLDAFAGKGLQHAVRKREQKRANESRDSCKQLTASKAILYASRDLVLPMSQIKKLQLLPRSSFADIPTSQQAIGGQLCFQAGSPIITVRNQQKSSVDSPRKRRAEHLSALRQLSEEFLSAIHAS